MKLEDVAKISSGLLTSRKKEEHGNKKYKEITLKTLDNTGKLDFEKVKKFRSSEDLSRYIVKKGDIILKFTSPFTAKYIPELEDEYILSHYYCKIECNRDKILPKYLAWYLNSNQTKHFFEKLSYGTIVRKLPIKKFRNLKIEVIPIEKQRKIVELYDLVKEEEKLLNDLIDLRRDQMRGITKEIFEKEKKS